MNQLTVQSSNLISVYNRINRSSARSAQTSSTNQSFGNSFPGTQSSSILQKRMSVVNLEAAAGAKNPEQINRLSELGLAYRFNKTCGLRLSPSLLGQSSFGFARHLLG